MRLNRIFLDGQKSRGQGVERLLRDYLENTHRIRIRDSEEKEKTKNEKKRKRERKKEGKRVKKKKCFSL